MSILAVADVITYLGKGADISEAERGLVTMLLPMAEGTLRNFIGYNPEYAQRVEFYPERDLFPSDSVESFEKVGDRVLVGAAGADTNILPLRNLPVRSITSVYEDAAAYGSQGSGDFPATALLTSGTDYYLDVGVSGHSMTGFLVRIHGAWPRRRRTVKVTYYSGFTAAEFDGTATQGVDAQGLKFAALLTVVAAVKEAMAWQGAAQGGSGPLASEWIQAAGHSVTYAENNAVTTGMLVALPPKAKQLAQPFRRYAL